MRRAVLIHNPTAGIRKRADVVEQIGSILDAGGVEVVAAPTEAPGHATAIAAEVAQTGSADTVLAFGGDGTLREAASGLLGTNVALAPLSAGTTNVVTRSLHLPVEPRKAARKLLDYEPVACDVGLCNEEPFLILASFGVDAAIMARVTSRFKNLAGRGAIVATGLSTWWSYPYPETAYEADGETGRATFLAAANIAEYGGDFKLAPDADFLNRRLTLVAFEGRGRLATLRFAFNLILGRHIGMRDVRTAPLTELRVPGPTAAPLELDGDYIELEPPLVIRLAEQQIRLLMAKDPS